MKHLFTAICSVSILVLPSISKAQFHQKTDTGQTTARQMTNNYNGSTGMTGGRSLRNRKINGAAVNAVVVSNQAVEFARKQAGPHVKVGIEYTELGDPDVWGRAENHPNGTYTETIFDEKSDQVSNMVIQRTKKKSMSGDDPVVMIRRITLTPVGEPDEVMIFDGAGNYKFRGKFVYDNWGRVTEQRLWSAAGEPLRKIVQKYDEDGEPRPLETYDYSKRIPADLQLVVSKSSPLDKEQLMELEKALQESNQASGLFSKHKQRQAKIKAAEIQDQIDEQKYNARPSAPPAATATPASPEPKRFQLFRRRPKN